MYSHQLSSVLIYNIKLLGTPIRAHWNITTALQTVLSSQTLKLSETRGSMVCVVGKLKILPKK